MAMKNQKQKPIPKEYKKELEEYDKREEARRINIKKIKGHS